MAMFEIKQTIFTKWIGFLKLSCNHEIRVRILLQSFCQEGDLIDLGSRSQCEAPYENSYEFTSHHDRRFPCSGVVQTTDNGKLVSLAFSLPVTKIRSASLHYKPQFGPLGVTQRQMCLSICLQKGSRLSRQVFSENENDRLLLRMWNILLMALIHLKAI